MGNNEKKPNTLLIGLLWFLLGLVVGLVVLGWWLWPVNWIGGDFSTLQPADQQEYLQTVIEAYSFNSDGAAALKSYISIGQNRDSLLRQLYQSPGYIPQEQIEAFATTVGADLMLTGTIEPTTAAPFSESPSNLITSTASKINPGKAALLGFLLLLLIILLIIRNRNKKRRETVIEPVIRTYNTPNVGSVEPAPSPISETEVSKSDFESRELPDWLKDDNQQDDLYINPVGIDLELSEEDYDDLSPLESAEFEIEEDYNEQSPHEAPDLDAGRDTDYSSPFEAADLEVEEDTDYPPPFEAGDFEVDEDTDYTSPFEAADLEVKEDTNFISLIEAAEYEIEAETKTPLENFENYRVSQGESPEQTYQKFTESIEAIPGLGSDEAQLLKTAGVGVPLLLLKQGSNLEGRQELSERSGIDSVKLLQWIELIDLLRIPELTWEDLRHLESAGIRGIRDLAGSTADTIFVDIRNKALQMDPLFILPSKELIENWIEFS